MRCAIEKMSPLRGIYHLHKFEQAATEALKSSGLIGKYGNIPGIVRFVLTTTSRMTKLNGLHLHHDGATDVITYSYFDDALFSSCAGKDDEQEPVLAEIYICPDIARKYAEQFHHHVSRELFLYAVHGLLHCAGLNDISDEERQEMRRAEAKVLQEIEKKFSLLDFMKEQNT